MCPEPLGKVCPSGRAPCRFPIASGFLVQIVVTTGRCDPFMIGDSQHPKVLPIAARPNLADMVYLVPLRDRTVL